MKQRRHGTMRADGTSQNTAQSLTVKVPHGYAYSLEQIEVADTSPTQLVWELRAGVAYNVVSPSACLIMCICH